MELFKYLTKEKVACKAGVDTRMPGKEGTFAHGYLSALHALEITLGSELCNVLDRLYVMKDRNEFGKELPWDHPSVKLGSWMSAALDDPAVCDEMKADIHAWMMAGQPVPVYPEEDFTDPKPVTLSFQRLGHVMRVRMLGDVAREETLRRHEMAFDEIPTREEVVRMLPALDLPDVGRTVFWVRDDDGHVHTISYYPERDAVVRESCASAVLYKVKRHG